MNIEDRLALKDARIEELEKRLEGITEAYAATMEEECVESDDRRHCTCVPFLRAEIKRLKACVLEKGEQMNIEYRLARLLGDEKEQDGYVTLRADVLDGALVSLRDEIERLKTAVDWGVAEIERLKGCVPEKKILQFDVPSDYDWRSHNKEGWNECVDEIKKRMGGVTNEQM